ncbi:ribonuclease inhibitor-like [Petromyzon marinus]|uniref:ribonuclease inhibitor-like n=1 Tax=Petromyzon marinus TaxID=7757 RepID=UPI003F6F3199
MRTLQSPDGAGVSASLEPLSHSLDSRSTRPSGGVSATWQDTGSTSSSLLSSDESTGTFFFLAAFLDISACLYLCSLTDKSGSSLSVILKANTGLKILRLRRNEIGDSGLRLLADGMLEREGRLETLALIECSLTDKSIPALHDIMITNKALRKLGVDGNRFSEEGKQELRSRWTHRGGLDI